VPFTTGAFMVFAAALFAFLAALSVARTL
jgi:hypothetical protein